MVKTKRIASLLVILALLALTACTLSASGGQTSPSATPQSPQSVGMATPLAQAAVAPTSTSFPLMTPTPGGLNATPAEPPATETAPPTSTTDSAEPSPTLPTGLGQAEPGEEITSLPDTSWVLDSFEQVDDSGVSLTTLVVTPVGAESPAGITLEFDAQGNISGNGGCNLYAGSYAVHDYLLTVGPIASTKRACADSELNMQEQRYYEALQSANAYQLGGGRLRVAYHSGQGLLNFAPAAAIPNAVAPIEGLCATLFDPQTNQWSCRSAAYEFEVAYPPGGYLAKQTDTTARIDLPHVEGTNLSEKYLEIAVADNAATCSSPAAGYAPGTLPTEQVILNGVEFTKQTGQDAGVGNVYQWTSYATTRDEVCVSLAFVLHSFRADLMPTPPPEFDVAAASQVFESVAGSFRWLGSGGGPAITTPPAAGINTQGAVRIRFASGATSARVSGHLAASASHLYVLRALKGQTMTVDMSFANGSAILTVWGANGSVLLPESAGERYFRGVLPATQDYYLRVTGRQDGGTNYQMSIRIPPLAAAPTNAPTIRIRFKTGKISGSASGHLAAGGSQLYVLRALKGQTMTVKLTFEKGSAILAVWGANGAVLQATNAGESNFKGVLPATQDYYIRVIGRAAGETDYLLKVNIPPL